MSRPIVLVLAGRYLPGYKAGGPVRSISNLVEALGDELEFRLIAYDQDLGDLEPYKSAVYGEWQAVGKALVWWVRPGADAGAQILKGIERSRHRLLYVNNFFDPVFGFGALNHRSAPILLAPRGQFGLGAMRIKSLRKNVLLKFLALRGSFRSLSWQATDATEIEDILRTVPGVLRESVYLAPNLAEPPAKELPLKHGKQQGALRICFLSRISPKKNLDGAIRIVSELRGQISFTVFGPIEDEDYGRKCLELLSHLPYNVEAKYSGPLPHEQVREALQGSDILLLPTLGENFGHAIYEALSVGTPVVIGDRTPWQNLAIAKAGSEFPVENENLFRNSVQGFVDMDASQFADWANGAWLMACSYSAHSDALEASRLMFNKLLGSER